MGFFSRPLPWQSIKQDSYQLQCNHDHDHFHLNDSSSSNSSIFSQLSLPSVPSLTPPAGKSPSTTNHHCVATLKGHSSYVFSLALAGKNLYSGSSDSEIRLWNQDPSSSSNHNLAHHNIVAQGYSAVKSIVVLADKLFTAHHDHKIRVWKIENEVFIPHQEFSTVYQTCLKYIATLPTVSDRCMKLFSPKNYVQVRRHKKCTWVHHVDTVSALALSKNGSVLYSVSWDRTFKVWRTSDLKCLESVLSAHDDAINAIVLSDEGYVYTGSADKKIKVWKKHEENGKQKHSLLATLQKHISAVNALAISTDGAVLYSGACDRSIIVWEKKVSGGGDDHMVVAGALRGHTKAILCLAVVSDLLCSGSADKTVRIWRTGNSYSCLAVFEGHKGPVKCLTASIDSKNVEDATESGNSYLVYSGSLDIDIKTWQIWVPNF